MRRSITMEGSYGANSLSINTSLSKGQGCFAHILDHLEQSLDISLETYSKVLLARFDLHLPDGFSGSPEAVRSEFFRKLNSTLKRKSKSRNPHRNHANLWYGCVIEYGDSGTTVLGKKVPKDKPHYHCWLALSGHKIRHPGIAPSDSELGSGLMRLISDIWLDIGGSYVWRADHHLLHRSDGKGDDYRNAFMHVSYMAKTRDKYFEKSSGNQFTGSRINKAQVGVAA